jgi:hypothetical protein
MRNACPNCGGTDHLKLDDGVWCLECGTCFSVPPSWLAKWSQNAVAFVLLVLWWLYLLGLVAWVILFKRHRSPARAHKPDR